MKNKTIKMLILMKIVILVYQDIIVGWMNLLKKVKELHSIKAVKKGIGMILVSMRMIINIIEVLHSY